MTSESISTPVRSNSSNCRARAYGSSEYPFLREEIFRSRLDLCCSNSYLADRIISSRELAAPTTLPPDPATLEEEAYPPPKLSTALAPARLDRVCLIRCCSCHCFCFSVCSSAAIFSWRSLYRPSSVMYPTCLALPMGTKDPAGCCCCIRIRRKLSGMLTIWYNFPAAVLTGCPLSTDPPRNFSMVAVARVPSCESCCPMPSAVRTISFSGPLALPSLFSICSTIRCSTNAVFKFLSGSTAISILYRSSPFMTHDSLPCIKTCCIKCIVFVSASTECLCEFPSVQSTASSHISSAIDSPRVPPPNSLSVVPF
mmetsp:Transcript_8323/g.20443  ORF Transcript_8323/g.20443 Transcript_8323/m.20443 type:complete len:312 (-) Transcript_8323:279-1214(-)